MRKYFNIYKRGRWVYGFDVYGNFFFEFFFPSFYNVQEEELFFVCMFAVPDASFDFVGY